MKTTMKKPNITKQKPAARENATAFIHLKIKPSELAALKLAAGKQPFGAWVREACQSASDKDVGNMSLLSICAGFVQLSQNLAVALTAEQITESTLALTAHCHAARAAIAKAKATLPTPEQSALSTLKLALRRIQVESSPEAEANPQHLTNLLLRINSIASAALK